jgi:hypothetical protein
MSTIEKMPKDSKVWIYQSDRKLSKTEAETIKNKGELFIDNWTSHDKQMKATIEIKYDVFVVVAVDESIAGASGCGIDKLMKFIQVLGHELKIDFFNRLKIAYLTKENQVEFFNASNIDVLLEKNEIQNDTMIFCNHSVSILDDLEKLWKQKLNESWLSHNYSTK